MDEHSSEKGMLEKPFVRYGVGFGFAAILVVVAFVYFDGIARWFLLGLAIFEIVFLPRQLEDMAESDQHEQHDNV